MAEEAEAEHGRGAWQRAQDHQEAGDDAAHQEHQECQVACAEDIHALPPCASRGRYWRQLL